VQRSNLEPFAAGRRDQVERVCPLEASALRDTQHHLRSRATSTSDHWCQHPVGAVALRLRPLSARDICVFKVLYNFLGVISCTTLALYLVVLRCISRGTLVSDVDDLVLMKQHWQGSRFTFRDQVLYAYIPHNCYMDGHYHLEQIHCCNFYGLNPPHITLSVPPVANPSYPMNASILWE
jgi:hypothetical protein